MPFAIEAKRSDPNRPARPFAEPYRGPLFDTQAHLDPARGMPTITNPGVVATAMAQAHVGGLILMPVPAVGRLTGADDLGRRLDSLRENSDGRISIMCGSDYLSGWMSTAASSGRIPAGIDQQMARLRGDLQSGRCIGAGEIGFRHYDKSGRAPVVDLPAGYPPLLAIADTAAAAGVWLALHAEPVAPDGSRHDAEVFGTVGLMFQHTPNLRLRLSHTGMTNPHNARALLHAFPNLMMSILPHAPEDWWSNLESVTNADEAIYTDWATLFEDMSERFTVGTDFMFGRHDDAHAIEDYARLIHLTRRMLGSLSPEVAKRVAWQNAVRAFGSRK